APAQPVRTGVIAVLMSVEPNEPGAALPAAYPLCTGLFAFPMGAIPTRIRYGACASIWRASGRCIRFRAIAAWFCSERLQTQFRAEAVFNIDPVPRWQGSRQLTGVNQDPNQRHAVPGVDASRHFFHLCQSIYRKGV